MKKIITESKGIKRTIASFLITVATIAPAIPFLAPYTELISTTAGILGGVGVGHAGVAVVRKKIDGVGLGLGWFKISSQIKDHRFHIAAVRHDASWDAWKVYKGALAWADVAQDETYREMVGHIYHKQVDEKLSKKKFFKREDQIFLEMCLELSRTDVEVLQANLFYRLVRIRSLFP